MLRFKGKNWEIPTAGETPKSTEEAEQAFNATREAILESRETSHDNELADLKDEHDDELRELKRDHAAALGQLETKLKSEEWKKVVLQKRVKRLTEQLASSKEEAK